ncbi:hypothetical protein AGABI1DRAFT_111333 [Agaricus bisporus var. burnettii JB137-S8]|uniref:EF-hand domain-containing protein n=1 Tax=Agaricus bisporus var. burnettii (strain JB137-S8 / ATCC MYA-4627 / FGSC 10392) TaxID=597362 RepID=K5XH27_AGABU|nr:uncharacterized protein AGABI1DRAFT_111333 [Agaricus bisporus var. burnettii JB137-S8]EKM82753.1 hypothetical protein AGABI1DRAFT_111333 [Agaricus bisporus var. burnettii JB137-S8]
MSMSAFDAGSPRPETPEPSSIQGRRNTETNVQLLDDEGIISDELEACLKHIFAKYCSPPHPLAHAPDGSADGSGRMVLLTPASNAFLSPEGLDAWARDTNGAPFSQETKDELVEFLDVTDDGGLTFKGFMQIYQLQTENDEEETWRDLSSHGFDRTLRLVSTRREDAELEEEGGHVTYAEDIICRNQRGES